MARKKNKKKQIIPALSEMTHTSQIDALLTTMANQSYITLRNAMKHAKVFKDAKLRTHYIYHLRELIRKAEMKETVNKAVNARHIPRDFERNTPNDQYHHPYLIYIASGGQNKQY